jgi:hypothetical protein
METACTSEMSVNIYLTTQQYIPEDSELHTCHCGNLKSHVNVLVQKDCNVDTISASVVHHEVSTGHLNLVPIPSHQFVSFTLTSLSTVKIM